VAALLTSVDHATMPTKEEKEEAKRLKLEAKEAANKAKAEAKAQKEAEKEVPHRIHCTAVPLCDHQSARPQISNARTLLLLLVPTKLRYTPSRHLTLTHPASHCSTFRPSTDLLTRAHACGCLQAKKKAAADAKQAAADAKQSAKDAKGAAKLAKKGSKATSITTSVPCTSLHTSLNITSCVCARALPLMCSDPVARNISTATAAAVRIHHATTKVHSPCSYNCRAECSGPSIIETSHPC
jgi:hypothetical protein